MANEKKPNWFSFGNQIMSQVNEEGPPQIGICESVCGGVCRENQRFGITMGSRE